MRHLVGAGLVGRWATASAERARRNAMTACTVLAVRRQERLEVAAFVAEHLDRRQGRQIDDRQQDRLSAV